MMASTRNGHEIFLIGLDETNSLIAFNQLLTNIKVLQRFHKHVKIVASVENASHVPIDKLFSCCEKLQFQLFSEPMLFKN